MVEEANALLYEDHAKLLGRLVHGGVVLTTTGCRDVLDTGAVGAVDVVDEGELVVQIRRL